VGHGIQDKRFEDRFADHISGTEERGKYDAKIQYFENDIRNVM
jgi:hypothetical protein